MPVTGRRKRSGHRLGLNCSGESGCSRVLRPIFFARGSGSTRVIRELFGVFGFRAAPGRGSGSGFCSSAGPQPEQLFVKPSAGPGILPDFCQKKRDAAQ